MSDTEILDRRHMLIAALKAGIYRQGFSNMLTQRLLYDNDRDGMPVRIAIPDTQRLCCLGVGMAIADDEWLQRGIHSAQGEYDLAPDYDRVRELYDISPKLMNYLMGMNDGDLVQDPDKKIEVAHTPHVPNSPVYTVPKTIRLGALNRDFKFIARFLEIVWGLK